MLTALSLKKVMSWFASEAEIQRVDLPLGLAQRYSDERRSNEDCLSIDSRAQSSGDV